jgi:hypothetical protein
LIIPVGIVVYLLFAKSGKPLGTWAKSGETPKTFLQSVYQREITEEEYKKMQKIIHE